MDIKKYIDMHIMHFKCVCFFFFKVSPESL